MEELNRYRAEWIQKVKRVLIKIGSGILASRTSGLDISTIESLAKDIVSIQNRGVRVVVVSSGAIIAGMQKLSMKERPKKMADKQAAAAIGQTKLMYTYEHSFQKYDQQVAQILLTYDDLMNRKRFLNARHTIFNLLDRNVIPIINENDTVAVEEIKLGDNDKLSSLVVNLIDSTLLVILSDVDGLFTANPKKDKNAQLISFVDDTASFFTAKNKESLKSDGETGTGGMQTKLAAARTASSLGAATVIANGKTKGVLSKIFDAQEIGTFFVPQKNHLLSRKHWIAYAMKVRGKICVDEGAVRAIFQNGKSLLPSGVVSVQGNFNSGDMVSCVETNGKEFARGIVSFSSEEIKRIKGLHTEKIISILGYSSYDEVIHRNDLVLLKDEK